MATPRTKEQARANLESAAPSIGPRYAQGVQTADWAGPAGSDAAEANFAANMQKAIAAKKRQAGVKSVSNQDWRSAAVNKGAAIIGQRVTEAIPKWISTWGPIYDQVVATVQSLPPKGVDFRQNINNRLVKTVEAWKKASGKS